MIRIIRFPIRCLVFLVAFFFYFMEATTDWILGVQAKTEYIRTGSCNRCGRCCRLLALEVPRLLLRWPLLEKLLIRYHGFCFNFQSEGRDGNWLIYSCGYLKDGDTVKCRIYHFRHRLCRFFPRQRLYGHPKLHKECGFKFVRRDGKPTFDDILEEKRKSQSLCKR